MATIKIIPVDSKDKERAVEILLAAFEQDPLMSYFFGNEYHNLAKYVMEYVCNLPSLSNSVLWGAFVEEKLAGVALVTPPKAKEQNRQEAIALADEQLAIAIGEAVITRMETYFQIKDANKPKQPHFYLDILAVSPECQGPGVGKALLETIHKMSESSPQSVGVALDTENEDNLDLYRRFGYSLSTTTKLDRLTIWSMFRSQTI